MSLRLTFYGGAGKVTGSNFLVENEKAKILVDCGIEQGADVAVQDVYGLFPYEPRSIEALVVTHAHLDHVGRIPKLVKEGFRGRIVMTPPTRDLAELILRDSIDILAEDARRRGLEQLYSDTDVDTALSLIEPLEYHKEKEVAPWLSVSLANTGHILGSASVRIRDERDGTALALTGDIGNSPSPLLPDWEPVPDVDALVMESVYGNRVHPLHAERIGCLREALRRAIARGGAILMPAFSLERTQLMLYELSNFFAAAPPAGGLPQVPVYLDSPLAIHVTEVYEKWGPTYFKPEAEDEMKMEGSLFEFPFLHKTLSREESEAIERAPNPKIIIAGAGMSHGGRIGRWEAQHLPDPKTTLFTVGYQAPGSPGRRIAEGASSVRISESNVPIRAKVEILEGWSAHADRDELLRFADACLHGRPSDRHDRHDVSVNSHSRLKVIFTALGEPAAERFLAQRIHDYLGVRAVVPDYGQTWEVAQASARRIR